MESELNTPMIVNWEQIRRNPAMERLDAYQFDKFFVKRNDTLYLRAGQIMKDLVISAQPYAPKPTYDRNGDYEYKFVVAYNTRYLVKDNQMNYKPRHEWDLFYCIPD